MEHPAKRLPRVAPIPLPDKNRCHFYHCLDLPNGDTVIGEWELRGQFNQYIGNYPVRGKTILDVGTAGGFLAFSAEAEGATVTSLDCRDVSDMERVPFVNNEYHTDRSAWDVGGNKDHWNQIKNGFWYSWHKLNSRVSVTYTPIRALQYYDEKFDVVLAGAIIEHLADPVSTIGAICRMAKEAVIIAFTPVEIDQAQFMRTMNPWSNPEIDYVWWVLSEGLYRRVFANLGFEIELVPAKATYLTNLGEAHEEQRYTIVARRVVPLGKQPLVIPDQAAPAPASGLARRFFRMGKT